MKPGILYYNAWDFHIYENHISAVKEQIIREPKEFPKLILSPDIDNIDDFKYSDFTIEGYDPHPKIKAELNT